MGFWLFGSSKRRSSKPEDQSSENQQPKPERESVDEMEIPRHGSVARQGSKRRQGDERKKLSKASLRGTSLASTQSPSSSSRRTPADRAGQIRDIEKDLSQNLAGPSAGQGIYHQPTFSQSSIGPEVFNVDLLPTLRGKRADNDTPVPRRKSSKRKAEDHAREQEVKAMSSEKSMSKRPASRSSGPLRQETKAVPGGLNKRLDRPISEVALPMPDYFSRTGGLANQHSFRVSVFDVLSPRPTVRYDKNPLDGRSKAQPQPRPLTRPLMDEDDLSSKKRIADLADDLDSGALRELMERDKRRRERKRDADVAKLQRKLQRRAERQKEEDARRLREGLEEKTSNESSDKDKGAGLGIDTSVAGGGASKELDLNSSKDRPQLLAAQSWTRTPPPEKMLPLDRFTEVKDIEVDEAAAAVQEPNTWPQTPAKEDPDAHDPFVDPENKEPELPVRSPLRGVRPPLPMPEATISPPTSPQQSATHRPSLSQGSALGLKVLSSEARENQSPLASSALDETPSTSWTTFFRRSVPKKTSIDRGRVSVSEFSNTSRESISRQPPPPLVPPRTFRGSGSGAGPRRTQSRFREDLPELPMSPPDSRVQSPDIPIVPKRSSRVQSRSFSAGADIKNLMTSPSLPVMIRGRPEDRLSQHRSMDLQSIDTAPSTTVLSQSLASVDSEGSWLSGRPIKRSSLITGHTLHHGEGSRPQSPRVATFEGEVEDDLSKYDHLKRLVHEPDEKRRRSYESAPWRPSGTAIALDDESGSDLDPMSSSPEQPFRIRHGSVGRQPTLVRQGTRAISKEGLLNEYEAAESEGSSPGEEIAHSDLETHFAVTTSPALRARSVEYGRGHARHISAGSARLLDIRRSSTHSETLIGDRSSGFVRPRSSLRPDEEDEGSLTQ